MFIMICMSFLNEELELLGEMANDFLLIAICSQIWYDLDEFGLIMSFISILSKTFILQTC